MGIMGFEQTIHAAFDHKAFGSLRITTNCVAVTTNNFSILRVMNYGSGRDASIHSMDLRWSMTTLFRFTLLCCRELATLLALCLECSGPISFSCQGETVKAVVLHNISISPVSRDAIRLCYIIGLSTHDSLTLMSLTECARQ
jgi:hypothetical protein